MSFITGIPNSVKYKNNSIAIVTVMDQHLKICYHILFVSNILAEDQAKSITPNVILFYQVDSPIIFDRR